MVGDRDPSHRRELEALFSAAPNRVIRTKVRERYSSAGPRARPGPVHCIRPFEEIAVGPDGHVALCCNDILREHDFGNLLEDDPEEIWVRRMNALRRDNRSPLCLGCRATGQGPGRFMAATLMSPVGARRRFLRLASILARAASVCRSPSQPGCPGGPSS
jgi:radical SAM protein with 4Fe4S-binding SPASM domain